MRIIKRFADFIGESENNRLKDQKKVITVTCRDTENSLEELLKYIQQNGNGGHSFSIVVDPDGDKDQKKTFGWDGDGSDRIFDISSEMVDEEEEEKVEESEKGVDLRDDKSCKCKGCGNPVKEGMLLCEKCEERGFYIAPNGKVISPEESMDEQADTKRKTYPVKEIQIPFCTLCGTKKSDPKNGYCINGHDSWLEYQDMSNEFGEKFCKKQKISLDELKKMFSSIKDVKISNPYQT
jgi:hypothetical protein